MKFSIFPVLFFLCAASLFAETAQETLARYRGAMRELADSVRAEGMDLEAKVTESRIWEDPPFGFFIPRPPRCSVSELPEEAAPRQREWFDRMRSIESDCGEKLLTKARELAAAGKGREGYRYAKLAFFVDPENEEARTLFGYRLDKGLWRRDWELDRLKKGFVKDPDLGWITSKEKERMQTDPAVESGKITVETEHFEVKTSLPRPVAVRLAQRLEEFYTVWDTVFFPLTVTDRQAASVLLGKGKRAPTRHKTVLFRSRDEYLREILRLDPGGGISSGGYFPDKKTVFLYQPDPQNEDDTPLEVMAVHETAHQLFAETGFIRGSAQRRRADPGREAQFWLTEGIACYLETFEPSGRGWNIGGVRSYRFLRAKERAAEPGGLLPLEELAQMGKDAFQGAANPAMLYTESAGLVSFFLHGEEGKYAPAFLEALRALYQGEDVPELLESKTGTPYARLDEEFHAYLHAAPFTE